jgi:hypothetical protein
MSKTSKTIYDGRVANMCFGKLFHWIVVLSLSSMKSYLTGKCIFVTAISIGQFDVGHGLVCLVHSK